LSYSNKSLTPKPLTNPAEWIAATLTRLENMSRQGIPSDSEPQIAQHAAQLPPIRPRWTPELETQIIARYQSGDNATAIGRDFAMSRWRVVDMLKRHGISIRRT
jgi:hypothetical protein